MRLQFAVPVLGALALVASLPDTAQAGGKSSFDISVGLGYSNYGGHGGYNSGVAFRYSRGYGGGYGHYGGHRHYGHGYHGGGHRYHGGGYYRGGYGYRHTAYHSPHYYNYPRYYAPRPVYRSYYPARRYYRGDYGYGYHGRPLYRRYYYRDYDYCY